MKIKKVLITILLSILYLLVIFVTTYFIKIYSDKINSYNKVKLKYDNLFKENEKLVSDIKKEEKTKEKLETTSRENLEKKESLEKIINEKEKEIEEKAKNENQNYQKKVTGKVIYLTFDDGPSNYTEDILNTLDKYNVKATFFVTCSGSLDKFAKKIIEKGHTLGLHTCTHRYNIVYSSEENYFNDLNSISAKVEELTGYKSKYIRFPGGSSNTISRFNKGIMTRLTQKVTEDGYKYYDWNIDSEDAAGADKEGVYNNVISALKNHNYSTNMVLMHDIKVSTKDALDSIIKDALDMGYTFSNINDYTNEVHHRINN